MGLVSSTWGMAICHASDWIASFVARSAIVILANLAVCVSSGLFEAGAGHDVVKLVEEHILSIVGQLILAG